LALPDLAKEVEGAATMNVGQVMTRNPRVCSIDDSLNQAAQVMWESDCGCVPLVNGEGKAVGMITDRDICMAAYTQGRALWQLPMAIAASQAVVSVRENDTLETAEALMQSHRIRRLPVLDADGKPIGILSMNDIARHAHTGHRHGNLNADSIVRTLAAICAPSRLQAAAQ
jgi:CBS domain-containing protein